MGENVSLIDGHIDNEIKQTNYERIRNMSVEEVVYCKNCKHLMFSDFYGECSKGYMGIVSPNDYCSKGERKERNK